MHSDKTAEEIQALKDQLTKLAELSRLRESKGWKELVAKYDERADTMKSGLLIAVREGLEKEKAFSEHEKDSQMVELFRCIVAELPDHPGSKYLAEDIGIQIENIESGIYNGIALNVGAALSTRSAKFYSDLDITRMTRSIYATIDSRLERSIAALKGEKKEEADDNDPYEEAPK